MRSGWRLVAVSSRLLSLGLVFALCVLLAPLHALAQSSLGVPTNTATARSVGDAAVKIMPDREVLGDAADRAAAEERATAAEREAAAHLYGGLDLGLTYTANKMTVGAAVYAEGSGDDPTILLAPLSRSKNITFARAYNVCPLTASQIPEDHYYGALIANRGNGFVDPGGTLGITKGYITLVLAWAQGPTLVNFMPAVSDPSSPTAAWWVSRIFVNSNA